MRSRCCRRSTREFARKFGIASGSVDELRAEVTANLTLELKRKIEAVVKQQVLQALRSTSQLVVPKSLVELEAQNLLRRTSEEMKQRGARRDPICRHRTTSSVRKPRSGLRSA